MRPDFTQPLADAVDLFDALGLRYALIGGVAAMFYGRPRFTEDIDFVVIAGHRRALERNPDAMRVHHFDPTCTFKLYHDGGIEIDLCKDEFADGIIARAAPADVGGRRVRMIELHDLIAMKLRAGRLNDDADIGQILQNNAVEEGRVAAMVGAEELERFAEIKRRSVRD